MSDLPILKIDALLQSFRVRVRRRPRRFAFWLSSLLFSAGAILSGRYGIQIFTDSGSVTLGYGHALYHPQTFAFELKECLDVFKWDEPNIGRVFVSCFDRPKIKWRWGAPQDVPFALPSFLLITIVSWLFWRREKGRHDPLCDDCGYDLRGSTTGICPECGHPAASATASTTTSE